MKTVSAREANQAFAKLLAEVAAGDEVVITRRGRPVAKLSPYAAETSVERCAAIEHMVELMKGGVHLGGLRATRDEMQER